MRDDPQEIPPTGVPMQRGRIVRFAGGAMLAGLLILLLGTKGSPTRRFPQREPVYFWHTWTGEWKERAIDKIVDRFNASQERYEVVQLSIPFANIEQKFLMSGAGGHPPDCVAVQGGTLPEWAARGMLTPLDTFMTAAEWATYQKVAYPIVLKVAKYGTHIYGVPTNMNTAACYYHPRLLREAGLDPDHFPITLEELMVWGEKLTVRDPDGAITRLGFQPEPLQRMAPYFGARFYDEKAGRVTINTPEILRALQFLDAFNKHYGFENLSRFRSSLRSGVNAAQWPFIPGQWVIAVDGQWRMDDLQKYAKDLEFRTAPLPPPQGGKWDGCFDGVNRLVIPQKASHGQGAWEFIKFWSGIEQPERAAEFYVLGAWLPTTTQIEHSPLYQKFLRENPQYQTFVNLLGREMETTPQIPLQNLIEDKLIEAESQVVLGVKTPAQALKDVQADLDHEQTRRKKLGLE